MLFKSKQVAGVEFRTNYPYNNIKIHVNPFLPGLTEEGIQAVVDEAGELMLGLWSGLVATL